MNSTQKRDRTRTRLTLMPGLEAIRERRYEGFTSKYGEEDRAKFMTIGNTLFYQFEKVARFWLASLNDYTDEQFSRKLSEAQWSIGELYYHLVMSTEDFYLRACRKCLENSGEIMEGGKTLLGKIVFLFGSLPPSKFYDLPSEKYMPQPPPRRAAMREELLKLIETMRALAPQLDQASLVQKWKHPTLGMLNAVEWYHLIEMHFRHHLRQKKRLDKFVIQSARLERQSATG